MKIKTSVIKLIIPKKLNFLSPYVTRNLMRLGNKGDGGYVIPKILINKVDILISFGISNDWSFEIDFKKLNPNLIIHAYDHTVSRNTFIKNIRLILLNMIVLRFSLKRLINSVNLLFSYLTFFKGDICHFEKRIHDYVHHSYDITFDEIISKTKSKNIFLKVDIEGSEYRIIDSIIKYSDRIDAIAIEFHNADAVRSIFISAIKKLEKQFMLVHLHVNNYAGYAKDGLPECSEITFLNRNLKIKTYGKRKSLPLPLLDFKNATTKLDYKLRFN
jgi:hypothetical protein